MEEEKKIARDRPIGGRVTLKRRRCSGNNPITILTPILPWSDGTTTANRFKQPINTNPNKYYLHPQTKIKTHTDGNTVLRGTATKIHPFIGGIFVF